MSCDNCAENIDNCCELTCRDIVEDDKDDPCVNWRE